MLVLLVIFIVTVPMMMKDVIGLNLPKTTSSDSQSFSTLAIAITKNGQYLLNGELTSPDLLSERCRSAAIKNNQVQARSRPAIPADSFRSIFSVKAP